MFNFDSQLFFSALALAFILEGAIWAISPDFMRKNMLYLSQLPNEQIRFVAITLVILGLILLYLFKI